MWLAVFCSLSSTFLSIIFGKTQQCPFTCFLYSVWLLFFYCYLFNLCYLLYIILFNFTLCYLVSINLFYSKSGLHSFNSYVFIIIVIFLTDFFNFISHHLILICFYGELGPGSSFFICICFVLDPFLIVFFDLIFKFFYDQEFYIVILLLRGWSWAHGQGYGFWILEQVYFRCFRFFLIFISLCYPSTFDLLGDGFTLLFFVFISIR